MSKLPTLAEARAAHDAAADRLQVAHTEYEAAVEARQTAQRAMNAAIKALREAKEREEVNAVARDRREAQTLAKRYGISIERDHIEGNYYHYWVLGPDAIYGGGWDAETAAAKGFRADPCEGDHIGVTWSEVLANVRAYVADIEALGAELAKGALAYDASVLIAKGSH